MSRPAAMSYKKNQVETATTGELTLMLYNGAIRFIKRAKDDINNKNLNGAHQSITRVQDIVDELIITLDRAYPISEQMLLLYDYMKRRLIEANVTKNIEILKEIEGMFNEFHDTWKQAMVLARTQKQ